MSHVKDIISAFERGYKKGLAEGRRKEKRDDGYLADKILAKFGARLSDGVYESTIARDMRHRGSKTDIRAALSDLEMVGALRYAGVVVRGKEVRRWCSMESEQ